ncbi:hypothetical protein D9758_005679 [Tetrapyrgos nigripes]|uniref:Uncharacterized protein n=1 Tax=Tetrapyrgos nigripes TaxID=182062 RepID=A0A8H5GK19_9AGAR|nr:hypothetical protein D9758_005679 [Tetrapyrgos nigripes]
MGNSQSSSSSHQQHHRRFSASPRPRSSNGSPAPGQPHRSMRQKKKSLELPDLAMLGITPTSVYEQQKSASIPIPSGRQANESKVYGIQPSDNIERNLGSGKGQAQQQGQGDPSNRGRARQSQVASTETPRLAPRAPPPSRERSPLTIIASTENLPSVIRSSLPLVLPKALETPVPVVATVVEEPAENHGAKELQEVKGRDSAEDMMVKISWHGGGNVVYLARAGDDDWKGRRKMERE